MSNDLQAALSAIDNRHEMNDGDLTKYLAENFQGSLLSLKQLQPLISEILRRFKRLSRRKSVEGTYPSIAGFRSFGTGKKDNVGWCQGVLHRTDRTVRYMLNGGNKSKVSPKKERVSVLDAVALLDYLDKHVSDLSVQQQKMLARGLAQFLIRLKRSIWTCKTEK